MFGELTPKVLAAQAADRVALVVARPVELLIVRHAAGRRASSPASRTSSSRLVFRGDAKVTHTVTEAELRMLIDISAEEGAVGEEEAELMERVFRFYDRRVNEVMVPRTEVVWLEAGTSDRRVLRSVRRDAALRFPVYRESLDNVVGIVNIKDVLRAIAQGKVTTKRRSTS